VGAEVDVDTCAVGRKRMAAGYTPDLFAGVMP